MATPTALAVQSTVGLPLDWSVTHTPAAAAQATASKAAGTGSVRHVCTSISAVIATVGTLQGPIQINLRDGASGAGTILWSQTVQLPVNGLAVIQLSGLNIVGSAATAMTLETSAAPVVGATASVSMTGHDAA